MQIIFLKITPSDGFSKLVCVECAFKLDVVYEFRERCLVTAQLFEQMGEQELVESYSQSQPSHDLHYEEIELVSLPRRWINLPTNTYS